MIGTRALIPMSMMFAIFAGPVLSQESLPEKKPVPHTETAMRAGLAWLFHHQAVEGPWKSDFTGLCKSGGCTGRGSLAGSDHAMTALGLLTFLGAGITPRRGGAWRKPTIEAIKALRAARDEKGCFPQGKCAWIYDHALCAQALCEAYGMTGKMELLKDLAEKAYKGVLEQQNADGGWGPEGKSDTISTAWAAMALLPGRIVGFPVPGEKVEKAAQWLDSVTDAATGKSGFRSRSDDLPLPGDYEGATEPRLTTTAAALVARIYLKAKGQDEMVDRAKVWLERFPFEAGEGNADSLYGYLGTQAAFQIGGQTWKGWNEKMKAALVPTQQKEGCETGSWTPAGPCAEKAGRLWSTCLNAMNLQVYYRIGRFYRRGK